MRSGTPQYRFIGFGKNYDADPYGVLFGTSVPRQKATLYDMGLQASYVLSAPCLATLMNTLICADCLFADMQVPSPLCLATDPEFFIFQFNFLPPESSPGLPAPYINSLRPVDGFSGFIILNLLQLQVSYKSTILMRDDQPQGTVRLKQEEQIDLEFHRDKRKAAGPGWGALAIWV